MKRLFATLLLYFGLANAVLAQTVNGPIPNAGAYGAYNSAPPTCVAGSGCWLQTDANGVLKVTASGGLTNYLVQPTASDNHVVIKAGAGQVYKISITNNSATINYVRLYNATTGFNGCNSATNLIYQNAIPASTGIIDSWQNGLPFATGISICVTSGYAQTDTTNATASAMNVNIGYK